jgi:hypothetical protein
LTAGFGGMIALVDGTIHHQDIRRALGHRRTVPADRLLEPVGSEISLPTLSFRPRRPGLSVAGLSACVVDGP